MLQSYHCAFQCLYHRKHNIIKVAVIEHEDASVTCRVAEVVCSEAFLNTWSDFWKKKKDKKKKQNKKSKVKKLSNEKIASSVTELIDFVAFFFFRNGFTKK